MSEKKNYQRLAAFIAPDSVHCNLKEFHNRLLELLNDKGFKTDKETYNDYRELEGKIKIWDANFVEISHLGALFSYFMDKIGLDGSEDSVVLDVGAKDLIHGSNTFHLVLLNNFSSILFETRNNRCEVIKSEIEKYDVAEKVHLSKNKLGWYHNSELIGHHHRGKPVTDSDVISLDDALESVSNQSEINLNSIKCVDLDIDGGEYLIWKQSEILKSVRPPLVVGEYNRVFPPFFSGNNSVGFRSHPFSTDYEYSSGEASFFSAIRTGIELGYVPVASDRINIMFVAEEYSDKIDLCNPNELFDYTDWLALMKRTTNKKLISETPRFTEPPYNL